MSKNTVGIIIGLISALALGGLFYLIYGLDHHSEISTKWDFLPALNAACNAFAAIFIIRGVTAIHHNDTEKHRRSMLSAFAVSTLFLIGYVIYHFVHGDSHFQGQGWVRPIYFAMLISHIILSVIVFPMVLTTFYLALSGKIEAHRKLAKFTYPIWLYVSVTGVLIFLFLETYGGSRMG